MDGRARRILLLGSVDFLLLYLLTLWLDARWGVSHREPFLYLLGVGLAAKALGDALMHLMSTSRELMYLDDYVVRELLVHLRFVFPLACLLAWAANVPLLLSPLRPYVLSPLAGVAAWGLNRLAVERSRFARPLGEAAATLTPPRNGGERPPGRE